MKEQYLINARIINPVNDTDEIGGLIIDDQGKIKASGKIIDELEKSEIIDKNLLRYMTVRVKKFNLEAKYFSKKDEYEKKEYKREYNRD